ncbi:hypothetical protein C7S13_3840 [Burkholderia cepacia]|nr:hypothetical protein [Burkholderia cepacia]
MRGRRAEAQCDARTRSEQIRCVVPRAVQHVKDIDPRLRIADDPIEA